VFPQPRMGDAHAHSGNTLWQEEEQQDPGDVPLGAVAG
jgi:hypothetical protein